MVDAVSLEVFRHLFASAAEEMGVTLQRTAYSPNIKERRDFSCSLFDGQGRMVAQAEHIPVHLGAMPTSVRVVIETTDPEPGDVVILNDPYLGGSHLPDITLVSCWEGPEGSQTPSRFYLASRAHHADVGGMSPGSMPRSTELYQEGVIIPPVKLYARGVLNQPLLDLICRNVRTPEERRGDLAAQLAAHRVGERRIAELLERYGQQAVAEHIDALIAYAERLTRAALARIPAGVYRFSDCLDDDGQVDQPVNLQVAVAAEGESVTVDFSGSDPEVLGCINAVEAVTQSATYYCVRCLIEEDIPINQGAFKPVHVVAPPGTVVNPRPPRAVVAGNVETSQRIVDVVFGALARALPGLVPAASQGTMNNLAFGGHDPARDQPFAYYETLGGGAGATANADGASGLHTHMSNTLNTPIEALEFALPVRIHRYALRRGSGGRGQHRGGDGLVREFEFLAPARVTVLSDRRQRGPYGLAGGEPGQPGRNRLRRAGDPSEEHLPGKFAQSLAAGDVLRLETPGGGGWGTPEEPQCD